MAKHARNRRVDGGAEPAALGGDVDERNGRRIGAQIDETSELKRC